MAKVKIISSFTHESKHFAADEIHDEKDISESCKDLVEPVESAKETVKKSDKEVSSPKTPQLKKL